MSFWRRDPGGPLLASFLILAAAPPLAAEDTAPFDPRGFLYGKVETRNGSVYEGRLRWDDEEAFWGDHFEATKEERPHRDKLPPEKESRSFKFFGFTFDRDSGSDDRRGFVARFGDIHKIEAGRGREARLTMRSGTEIAVEGGSDVGREVTVWDPEFGDIDIPWKNIETLEFLPTPADLEVDDRRLYGTVETTAGSFEGFLQWDRDECLASDRLDGDSPDGEVSIKMGKIRSIEKHTRSSSKIVLHSGREMVLEGSNDVDDDNRGIFVEDPRYGRVLISWSVFERVELSDPRTSGPSYAEFGEGAALHGRVTTRGGETHSGRLYYDLDESETWELLSGSRSEIVYHVPLSMVRSVAPNGSYHSRLTLTNGEVLELQDSADVDEDNDGVVIEAGNGVEDVYVPWGEVARVEFVPAAPGADSM